MDHSQSGPNGHVQQQQQQHNNHGSAYINFLDGHQSFTDDAYGVSEDNGTATDFDLSWNNPELFLAPQPHSTFSHQSPSPGPGFDHSARQQHSSTPNYGGIQSTLSPSPFSQSQAYDNRSLTQQPYDQRSMSRVLPTPSYPFQSTPYEQNPNYPSRDQMLSPSHFQRPVSNASMMLGAQQQPRPSPAMATNYGAQANQSTYQSMDPRQMHQPGYQSSELSHYAGFNEQAQQPASQFISPQMLTASGMRGGAGYQQQLQGQPVQHIPGSVSPYMNTLYGPDLRMYQTTQSFQQSIAPTYNMQGVQSTLTAAAPSTSSFQGVVVPPKTIKPKVPRDPNAPKKPRGRPKKDGSIAKVKRDGEPSSSEESESEDELQIEEPEAEITPAPLTLAPPTELKARAVYDAVYAVWSPRNLPAQTEKVKSGGQLYSDTIRKLRDAWKPENEALTAAENANNTAKASILKEKVEAYRDTLKKILDRTDQYGHPAHLRHVPLYPYTLSAFNSFLVDRIKRDDYEAPLVTSMMKTFTRFDTMTEEQLEQSKLIKLIQRISKKSNTETKALAQKVLDNATAATKAAKAKIQNDAAPASPKVTNGSSTIPARPVSQQAIALKTEAVAGVKRPLEGEGNPLPATKKALSKPIVQASKPLAVQQAERRKAELAKQNVAKNGKPTINGASAAPAPRPKVMTAPAKPASGGAFAGLLSASKKPGTSIAEKAAAAKFKPSVAPTTKKDLSPQPLSGPAKPAFSFLDALQGMDKPKEVEKKEEEVPANETEEERRKRLRKEERAHLHVSWADKLTDVRLFTHDPEEDMGHADSMRRDVDDVRSEGRMLKMHLDEDDLEDDEGEELDSYYSPSEVDFSDLDWEERKGHFVKTGGPEMPESKASEAQMLHEDSSLMVVYALPSDQPWSPKEPPDTEDDYEPDLATSFGEPPEPVREKERRWLAARPQERQAPAPNGTFDINAILRNMQHQQQPQATQPAQIPVELQRTLALLGQQQQQQHSQPVSQPQASFSDLSNIMAVVNQMKGIQQPQSNHNHQPQTIPPPIFTQPVANPIQPNVAAIMQALQAQNALSQGLPLPVGSHTNPNPFPGADEYSRKHARNDSGADDSDGTGKKSKKKKAAGTGSAAEVPYNYKTMVCSFWQKGTCTKGDSCTYRHSE